MTFGEYKGHRVYMMHSAKHQETNEYQLPFICNLRLPIPQHYLDFLQRKVEDGFKSLSLRVIVEEMDDNIWVRDRKTRRYQIQKGRLEKVLDRFKQYIRYRLAVKKVRAQYKNRVLYEDSLVSKIS